MEKQNMSSKRKKNGVKNLFIIAVIIVVVVGIPLVLLNYQAKRSGLTLSEVISRITNKVESENKKTESLDENRTGEKIDFLDSKTYWE